MEYRNISDKIIGLKNADLELRKKLIQNRQLGDGYNDEMQKLHSTNVENIE